MPTEYSFNSLVPRPIDGPTEVPLDPEADLSVLDEAKILAAPDREEDVARWRAQIRRWRDEARARLGDDGSLYTRAGAQWMQSCFTIAQVWLWDELLFDFEAGRFTPERLIEDAERRFGGFDLVLLWHAYPVIGIDERNQWDYYRDVEGLKELVDAFHARGVRVAVDYNPWDTQTRRGASDPEELAALVRDIGADAVFLDTLKTADPELVAALEAARPGIVLEGESRVLLARVADHSASWAQFFADSPVPGVVKTHYYEPRHMLHHVRRWHRDHREELQSAWLNGVGVMVWEVVFGAWVGWNDRDSATVRAITTLQRHFAPLLTGGEFTPLVDLPEGAWDKGVHASSWKGDDCELLALVNRGSETVCLAPRPACEGIVQFDPFTGEMGEALSISLAPGGIGCLVLAGREVVESHRDALGPLPLAGPGTESGAFPHRRARRLHAGVTSTHSNDEGVHVPAGEHILTVRYRARECGMYEGAPYVDEWKPLVPRLHDPRTLERCVTLESEVVVASKEVTNGEYLAFLEETGYEPRCRTRFLQHIAEGVAGREDEPVTFVDLDDARAYCAWVGGRLPSEDEWQLAAADPDFTRAEPAVWNWTESEFSDGRSRFCFLKGGSAEDLDESEWYFDAGVRSPEFSAKLLLMGLGMSRSRRIGFRVAWDGGAR